MTTYTFIYGSLLDPDSLRSTLPTAKIESLIPVRVHGFTRLWNVAFPNDGSQKDKVYYDEEGLRPPIVLFANIVANAGSPSSQTVNGLLVPVTDNELSKLTKRELRYRLVDITEHVCQYLEAEEPFKSGRYRVSGFVGRDVFTREEDVKRGVVPSSYMETVLRGVSFWEERFPGFKRDFYDSTIIAPETVVVPLRRVDL